MEEFREGGIKSDFLGRDWGVIKRYRVWKEELVEEEEKSLNKDRGFLYKSQKSTSAVCNYGYFGTKIELELGSSGRDRTATHLKEV